MHKHLRTTPVLTFDCLVLAVIAVVLTVDAETESRRYPAAIAWVQNTRSVWQPQLHTISLKQALHKHSSTARMVSLPSPYRFSQSEACIIKTPALPSPPVYTFRHTDRFSIPHRNQDEDLSAARCA